MKQLQNNYTTPEQSKRLLDLGLPADSADCYFLCSGQIMWRQKNIDPDNPDLNPFSDFDPNFFQKWNSFTPCWSVGRLIEIFEMCSGLEWPNDVIVGYSRIDMLLDDFETGKYYFDFSILEE